MRRPEARLVIVSRWAWSAP